MRLNVMLWGFGVCLAAAACGGDDGGDDGTGGSAGSGGSAGAAGSTGGGAGSSGSSGSSGASGTGGSASSLCAGVMGQCQVTGGGSCIEYGGTRSPETFTAYENGCTMEKNTWAAGSCSLATAFGACVFDTPDGPCSAIIYYPPTTEQDAQAACSGANGTWTTP